MIPGIEFGWADGQDQERCARHADADRMLCGRRVGFVPVDGQPAYTPSDLHEGCREALYGPRTKPQPTVECPGCGGAAPVADGRVGAHGVFRMSGGELTETSEPCVAVNVKVPVRRKR